MAIILACAAPLFFLSGFIGFVAWSDYADRGCPDAVQCGDAVGVMWIAGLLSLTCLALITLCVRRLYRGGLFRSNKAIEQK
ncbi:hypothetical protein HJA87_04155 [Rhizobium bangladeshense]|uniref:Transmembrane protein n=1 Tax=Rhizobium bangladeshense TaxID=1138189 RepID=A0ABS7LC74_9HYPH|nr:hypothetical protein [Rhizobium bangladeshense]MBX4874288.1 hypothetical protein [Rhizobium bangladeshense]MBX4883797.1 hypothetical protein [Rhizobium bangladeshense]MBY3589082.1 hypothetical protein [Rhizobium bangladeshense]